VPEAPRRLIPRRSLALIVAFAAAAAACNATGATAIPTAPADASSAPAASGPTAYATTTFGVPFSLTLPAGWKVFEEKPDMFAAYLSTDDQTRDAGVDIQLVPRVHADPCHPDAGDATGGSTAAELSTWMLAFAPLHGTAAAPATIGGTRALVVDEAFAGTPCVNAELWPTDGGWLDASERKRYFVFEVGGKRLVATIVSSDAKFDAQADAVLGILVSLRFGA
jgi:hypothetical protein